jgi:chromosomal replication initiation ATPase DnaA
MLRSALEFLSMEMPRGTFETWLRETRLAELTGAQATISAPNTHTKDWLENRLQSACRRALTTISGQPIERVRFVIGGEQ